MYQHAIPPTLTIFTATATAINGSVKRTLTSNAASVGIAFTCYGELTAPSRVDTFEDWIRSKSGTKENVLNQLSHAFRGSCLRSLPEFLEETKAYGTKTLNPQEQMNARISPTSINVRHSKNEDVSDTNSRLRSSSLQSRSANTRKQSSSSCRRSAKEIGCLLVTRAVVQWPEAASLL